MLATSNSSVFRLFISLCIHNCAFSSGRRFPARLHAACAAGESAAVQALVKFAHTTIQDISSPSFTGCRKKSTKFLQSGDLFHQHLTITCQILSSCCQMLVR